MNLTDSLNPVARRAAERRLQVHPEFRDLLQILEGGNFEASVPAPQRSQAGALVVSTAAAADIWVRVAPAQMCYGVDDEEEMLTVVNQLLRDEVLFVRTVDAKGTWTGTTLVRRVEDVTLETGETATVVSWSGRRDSTQSAG
jgi:hypothetical protein